MLLQGSRRHEMLAVHTFVDPDFRSELWHRRKALTSRFSFLALTRRRESHLIVSHRAVQLGFDVAPEHLIFYYSF